MFLSRNLNIMLGPECFYLSLSLGCKAIFLLGGKSRDDPPLAMFVRSGDVVLMAGEARECFHGKCELLAISIFGWFSCMCTYIHRLITHMFIHMHVHNIDTWKKYLLAKRIRVTMKDLIHPRRKNNYWKKTTKRILPKEFTLSHLRAPQSLSQPLSTGILWNILFIPEASSSPSIVWTSLRSTRRARESQKAKKNNNNKEIVFKNISNSHLAGFLEEDSSKLNSPTQGSAPHVISQNRPKGFKLFCHLCQKRREGHLTFSSSKNSQANINIQWTFGKELTLVVVTTLCHNPKVNDQCKERQSLVSLLLPKE